MNFAYGTQPQTLYPPLDRPPRDVGPPVELVRVGGPDAGAFRLGKINEDEVFLRTEIAERERLAKKRARAATICDGVAGGMTAASAAAEVGGIGLLSTVIAAPVVIGLEAGSLAIAGVGIALQACSRIARRKADKHDRIAILARAKLDSVADIVSKALADGHVDDAEFSLVVAELDRYRALKDEIRRSALQALPNGGASIRPRRRRPSASASARSLPPSSGTRSRPRPRRCSAPCSRRSKGGLGLSPLRRLAVGAAALLNAARYADSDNHVRRLHP